MRALSQKIQNVKVDESRYLDTFTKILTSIWTDWVPGDIDFTWMMKKVLVHFLSSPTSLSDYCILAAQTVTKHQTERANKKIAANKFIHFGFIHW